MECEPNNNFEVLQLVRRFEEMEKTGTSLYYEESDFHKLMEFYIDSFEYRSVLRVLTEAVEQYPYSIDFRLNLINCLIQLKDWKNALTEADKAARIAPADFEVQWIKAKVLLCSKSLDEAAELVENLKNGADNEELGRIYYLEGLLNEAKEDFEEMFECLKYSLLCDPGNQDSLSKIWVCAEMINAFDESIELHLHIINETPYSYMAWYNLGQAQSCQGEYEDALIAYEYSYLIEPDFGPGYQDRGDLLFELGRYKEALECYEEWHRISGPDADLMVLIGHCYLKIGDFSQAGYMLKKAKRLDPYNDEVHFLIGECHFHEGEYVSAIFNYQKAIQRENLREEYYVAMGSAYSRLGEYTKANFYFAKAEEIGPEQAYVWKKHSLFLFSIGQFQEALSVIEEGIENTMDAELMYSKAGMLVKIDRVKEGMVVLEEALMQKYEDQNTFHEIVAGIDLDENILSMFKFFAPQRS